MLKIIKENGFQQLESEKNPPAAGLNSFTSHKRFSWLTWDQIIRETTESVEHDAKYFKSEGKQFQIWGAYAAGESEIWDQKHLMPLQQRCVTLIL